MKAYQRAATYLTIVGAVAGCGADAPSQLEQTVQAQTGLAVSETVRGGRLVSPEAQIEQELDLSTPYNAIRASMSAYNNQDCDLAEKLVIRGSPYEKLVAEARKKGKVPNHKRISGFSVLKAESNDLNSTILYVRGTVEDNIIDSEVTMVYDSTGWKLFRSTK